MDSVELFGRSIKIRTHNCSLFGEPGTKSSPSVNFYIRTKYCNSKCKFCTYADDASKYNEEKYIKVLNEVASKIPIRKIAISGGEPTLYWDNFKNIATIAKKISPESELSMNTDGFRWSQLLEDPISELFDYIQLSRHHYNDSINDEIFHSKTPSSGEIEETLKLCNDRHKIQFRCNLIKGYIDSKEEVFKYLDWANSIGINDVGLVSLMPVNQYSKDNFVGFKIRDLIGDNFFLTKEWSYKGSCECVNYVYMPTDDKFRNPMRVYHKNTFKPSEITETIVFDGQNVRMGFDGEIIA